MRLAAAVLAAAMCAKAQSAAVRAEAAWKAEKWEEANAGFRQALKEDPESVKLRVRWALLLLERFNGAEAAGLIGEALVRDPKNAPAYVALARVQAEGFDSRALESVDKALALDGSLTEARELRAHLLIEDGEFEKAREEARRAPGSAMAAAALATVELLKDRPAEAELKAVGRDAKALERIARHFFLNRRYDEAIAFLRQAVESDAHLYSAQAELGLNLMRTGQDVEARQWLERAYQSGYRNAATANSLRLLDSYKNFVTVKRERFVLRLHKSEAELLGPYFERETARALEFYDRKFGVRLPGPVTVEVYPDHDDFAVRTMGLPGLGALGVTFGLSVAMDSPSGRKPGSFHWAGTLWHELAHVYTLTVTKHRVPRWFTEGISVHEETETSPEWGDRLTPDILAAMKKKELLPVEKLDRGFQRPKDPGQITVSYFQAGRTLDYITGRWGWPKVLEMLGAYGRLAPTAEVMDKVLGVKAEQFDKEFVAWLEKEHARPLAAFEEWTKGMKALAELKKSKKWPEVAEAAAKRLEEYPDYVEAASAYEALADARAELGDKKAAAQVLEDYARHGGRDPELLKRLAGWYLEGGDFAGAAKVLERVLYVYPVKDEALHRRLAQAWMELKKWESAREEWAAVVAMGTPDPASAEYGRALALKEMKRFEEAKDAVLAALETAPGYRPAQRLLMELNAKEGKP